MEDKNIVEMYLKRDTEAVCATAEKYGDYCFAVANNILRNNEDAEECVNDTYLRVWNAIPPNEPQNLKMFLARITRNLALDRYKENRREKRGSGAVDAALDELGECVGGGDDTAKAYEGKELQESVGNFVRSLNARDGDIFIRRYFFMESTVDISKKFGMRESNVLLMLSRTRKKLKKHLVKEGFLDE